jgi:hypothetical protein
VCNRQRERQTLTDTASCSIGLWNNVKVTVISGFRRDVDEIYALLGYYVALVLLVYQCFRTMYQSHLHGSRVWARKKASNCNVDCTRAGAK